MLSLSKKRKTQGSAKENAAQERLANSIVSACIRFQQRWANFMQLYTERLSRNAKLLVLSLFCLTAGSLSIYLIWSSMMRRKAPSITVIHFKQTPYVLKSGDENSKALMMVSKGEHEKIQRFRLYMDSLAKSPSGKQLYDSILSQRSGLMDSILLIEKIFQSQNKK